MYVIELESNSLDFNAEYFKFQLVFGMFSSSQKHSRSGLAIE